MVRSPVEIDSGDPFARSEGTGPLRPTHLRRANAAAVLALLRGQGPCSRADLVRASGLSAPTVSSAIEYLGRKRLVETLGAGVSSGGRPPGLLRFNARFGYVAGADIGGSAVRVALADLNGTILGRWAASTRGNATPQRIVASVATGVRELLRQHKVARSRLLTLAAGAPGITDVQAGIVISAPHLSQWQNVPLRELLQDKVGVSATIDNNVNLGALGESWCGAARGVRNFVFLAIGTGIGAGIFVDGRLHHGDDWAAGEVGYMHVPGTPDGILRFDRPGPLESVIGGAAIERAWRRMCHAGNGSVRRAQATQVFEYAKAGHPAARRLLQETARMVSNAVLNVSVVLNSSLVVLGGGIGTSQPLFEVTRRLLERNEFARPRLALGALGKDAQLFGAVRLALDHAEAGLLGAGA